VGSFALLVAVGTLLIGGFLSESGSRLRAQALWEGAQPKAGQAILLDNLMLLPASLEDGVAQEVSFALASPPVLGHAKRALFHKEKASVQLEEGVFQTDGGKTSLSFERLLLPLSGMGLFHPWEASRARAESMKRLSWPLMSLLLLMLSLPLALKNKGVAIVAFWIGGWVLIRLCDHQIESLGPLLCASLPTAASALVCVAVWTRWEDA
jgi:hypothetical protein